MFKRYDAYAVRQPLLGVLVLMVPLVVLSTLVFVLLRGWDRGVGYFPYAIAGAVGAGLPSYFTYRQRRNADPGLSNGGDR